jgi:hypothetical protein
MAINANTGFTKNDTILANIADLDPQFVTAYYRDRCNDTSMVCISCNTRHNYGVEYSLDWSKGEPYGLANYHQYLPNGAIHFCRSCIGTKGPKNSCGEQIFTDKDLLKVRKLLDLSRARTDIRAIKETILYERSSEGKEEKVQRLWMEHDIIEAWTEGAAKHHIIKNIKEASIHYGNTTEKQINLIKKIMADLKKPVVPGVEVPVGKIDLVGKFQSIRHESNQYNYNRSSIRKGLFVDDRGFKVWGTVPSQFDSMNDSDVLTSKFSFTADVVQSDKDKTFGFYKRPTKVNVLD